jgi:RNA recognition motif-containing protein
MNKLIKPQNSLIIKNNIVVGNLPNTSQNDILIYNKKQTEKKLKEINKSTDKAELVEITKTIAEWGYALGITVVAEDLATLNNFIRENFPNLSIFDLKMCVKMVSIDSDLLETDAEHYGKLTMIYVSKILKAYESYRGKVCFGVRDKIIKYEEQNKPKITKEERLQNFKELLSNAKIAIDSGETFQDVGEVVYNFIRHNKLISINKELISEAMDYGEKQFRISVSDYAKGNLKKMINDVSFSATKKEEIVKREARRYVAQYWVKNMDLEVMLKKLSFEMLLY